MSLPDPLGPLAATLPHAAAVLGCFGVMLTAARTAATAIMGGRAFQLLASWLVGIAGFVAGCVAFQTFAWGVVPSLAAAAHVIDGAGVPMAAVLLLGAVTALVLEVLRTSNPNAFPSRGGATPDPRRAEAAGALGESLVRAELATLWWPVLSNVVLPLGRGSAEIDHLVRTPDGILLIETKTFAGVVEGKRDREFWRRRTRAGVRRVRNPLVQNAAHLDAVRAAIADRGVDLRGLVVTAGSARFLPPIDACVVPVRELARVLRGSVTTGADQAALDEAWRRLEMAARRGETRRAAHVACARSRKRGRAWL